MQTDGAQTRSPARGACRMAAGAGLCYLLAGSLWIWLSDDLVQSLSRDPEWLVSAQRYKGLVYIVVTTFALVALMQAGYRRLQTLQRHAEQSQHRLREQARRERDEARDALNARLATMVAERTHELEEANLELEAFTRTAAHDLKSPLNGIVGMSNLLRRRAAEALGPAELRYLELIERSSRDMAALINDLLALSRAGSMPLERTQVDLAPFVREQIEALRTLEPLRRVQVVMPEQLVLCCDDGLMRSVLLNLITNAWKFTGRNDRARIELTLEQHEHGSVLTVADNGAGFDTTGLGETLRPFQRFHTQAQFQGNGLGLVTCQRIARRHGGSLVLQSTPGVGTRVKVVLPKA